MLLLITCPSHCRTCCCGIGRREECFEAYSLTWGNGAKVYARVARLQTDLELLPTLAEGVDAEVETRCMRTLFRNAKTRLWLLNDLVNLLKRRGMVRKRGALLTVSEARAVFGRVGCCRSQNATFPQLSAESKTAVSIVKGSRACVWKARWPARKWPAVYEGQ